MRRVAGRPVLFGAAAGLLATLVLMLVCAVLVHQRTLGEELIPTISLACLEAGCMLASFLAARRLPTAGSPSQLQADRWFF